MLKTKYFMFYKYFRYISKGLSFLDETLQWPLNEPFEKFP